MPPAPRLSLFLAYCPDKTAAGVLERRLRVREAHLRLFQQDKAAGRIEFGRGFLPQPGARLWTAPLPDNVTSGQQPMAGSVLLLRSESLESAWTRIKRDPYYTEGVWDDARLVLEEFCDPPPTVD